MSQSLVVELAHRADALPVRPDRKRSLRVIMSRALTPQLGIARQRAQLAKAADIRVGRETGCKC